MDASARLSAINEPDRCPRCGGPFACGAAGPAPCACFSLVLSAERQAALGRRWSGCLCLDCLRLAAEGALDDELQPRPGVL